MFKRIYNAIHFLANMIFCYYFISFAANLYAIVKWNGTIMQKYWSMWICQFLDARFVKMPKSQEVMKDKKGIILANHRTWSDFFIHDKIFDYSANFLSRYLVVVAIPMAIISQYFMKTLWFFNRDAPRKDFQKFFNWIDKKWSKSPRNNLLVYPEGHRMFDSKQPGPLKKGMIQYAFQRKIPVQIAISIGNEELINEKKIVLNRGSTITYFIDSPIDTSSFENNDQFYEHITKRFSEVFQLVYQEHFKSKKSD